MSYLDKDGVRKLWAKVKALFNKGVEVVADSSGGGGGNSIKFSAKDTTYNDATQVL